MSSSYNPSELYIKQRLQNTEQLIDLYLVVEVGRVSVITSNLSRTRRFHCVSVADVAAELRTSPVISTSESVLCKPGGGGTV